MEITVLHNQSFLDIAIQHTGSVFNAFSIAVSNGRAVSDVLIPGESLIIPDEVTNDDDVINYYQSKQLQPATGIIDLSVIELKRGIGWMKIGSSLKVD